LAKTTVLKLFYFSFVSVLFQLCGPVKGTSPAEDHLASEWVGVERPQNLVWVSQWVISEVVLAANLSIKIKNTGQDTQLRVQLDKAKQPHGTKSKTRNKLGAPI